jgi:hypothetical protein
MIGTIAEVTVTVTAFECPYIAPDDGRAAEIVAILAADDLHSSHREHAATD